ncbi:MAG: NAD(P)/FAD-dependent oxidoreductase [Halobacteriaceae archaeon]
MSASYVIIGDGVAGSSAAETIREHDADADVTVVTEEGEALYNRILIKEFAKGKLPEAPISIHDEDWYADRNVDLRLNTHVTQLDTDAKQVRTHEGETLEYDKLLVATGGTPNQLPVENADADGIHHFWTFQDARAIREHAEGADTGVVVGAGLLGIDLAAICGAQGIDANYLMRGNRWWRYGLGEEGAEIIHDGLRDMGVEPVFHSGVERFEVDEDGRVTATVDPNGDRYESEFVGVAIGLNFNVEFIQNTPIETDDGILVDEYMRTSVEDVYAAGDITRYYDTILEERAQNGSWGSAKQQGTIAGETMVAETAGDEPDEAFRWVSSYSITHFDFPFLSFGFPDRGDDECERRYSETEYRRLSFKNGKLIGGVLVGDLAPQSHYKRLIREEREVADQKEILLAEEVDPEQLAEAPPQEQ